MQNTGAIRYKGLNVAPKIKLTHTMLQVIVKPEEKMITEVIGHGNLTHGVKVALMWAAHFYNLGLREDDDLRFVGLCVAGKEKPPEGG